MAMKTTTLVARVVARSRSLAELAGVLIGLILFTWPASETSRRRASRSTSRTTSPRSIKAHCAKCHTDGTYKGSFSLDTRETMLKSKAIVPGKSGESELVERITSDDPEFRMPPKGDAARGRRGRPVHGVDRPEACPGTPGSHSSGQATSPRSSCVVPSFRRARMAATIRSIASSTPISPRMAYRRPRPLDDAAFARRAFLDVIGLLPPPGELEAFVKDTVARQALASDPPAARRPARLCRSLAELLERPAPQRLRRHRLYRRRPQADHGLALSVALSTTCPMTGLFAS